VFARQPDADLEVAVLDNRDERLLLAINWETSAAAKLTLRPAVTRACRSMEGFRITAAAEVCPVQHTVGDALELEPQDAVLIRLVR